ncbi:MAG: hypothetical protein U7M05_11360, partial [Candidatus Igneacidithiobacillus chanchocoensis]
SANLMSQSLTGKQGMAQVNQYKLAIDNFTGAMQTLKVAIGTELLPALTPLISGFASFITDIGQLAHSAPMATAAIAGLAAAFGALLVARGVISLFGSLRSVMALFSLSARAAGASAVIAGDGAVASGAAATSAVPAWLTARRTLIGLNGTAAESPAFFARMGAAWDATAATMAATARAAVASIGAIFSRLFIWLTGAFALWEALGAFKVAGHSLQQYAKVMAIAIYGTFANMFDKIIEGFYRLQAMAEATNGGSLKMHYSVSGMMQSLHDVQHPMALSQTNAGKRLAAFKESAGITAHARQLWVNNILYPHRPTPPALMPSSEGIAFNNLNAAADAVHLPPPMSLGGAAKRKSTAKKEASDHQKHQKAIDHLFAIADKAAAKADAVAAKMNAAAMKLHLAFLALTNPLGAKIAEVNLKYGALSAEMAKAGHPGAASQALAIGRHDVLKYQYQGAMQHLDTLKRNLHQNLTGAAALVTAGSLTKMQAAQQTIQMQKQAAPAMIQAADAALKYAKALGDPKLVQALQEQRTQLQAMGQQLGYYSSRVKNTMQGAFTGLFNNIMHGQKTWGQMFYSFFASIGKGIENILAKSISQSITTSLFGKKANQGIGSIIGGIAHMAGSLFGGSGGGAGILGAGASSAGGSGGFMSNVGGWIKGITSIASLFGFASGANNIPNDMVANIHKGEMIIPASGASLIRSGQAGIGGMPGGNHVHLTVHAMDSQSVISALHSVRHEAAQLFLNTATQMNLQGG